MLAYFGGRVFHADYMAVVHWIFCVCIPLKFKIALEKNNKNLLIGGVFINQFQSAETNKRTLDWNHLRGQIKHRLKWH